MASVLYKDGETTIVEYEQLQRHLDAGWSTAEGGEQEEKADDKTEDMSDYERQMRDRIKELGGRIGGRASIETIEKKLAELESEAE